MSAPPIPLPQVAVSAAVVPLDRDLFLRSLVRELAGTLEQVVGLDEAAGFVAAVAQKIGDDILAGYRAVLNVPALSQAQVAEVLVDLKRRIQGGFYVIEQDDDKIVLGNTACPFGDKVAGRPALCMMTSGVFGAITASNLGYAKVALEQTIATGFPGCRVAVYLRPTPASEAAGGVEYYPE